MSSENGESSGDFSVISPERLEHEAQIARVQIAQQNAVPEIVYPVPSALNVPADSRLSEVLRGTASVPSFYKNTVYDDVERSRIPKLVPSVFIRPTKYRSMGRSISNLNTTRSSRATHAADPACDESWTPEVRHTLKSKSMAKYLQIKACVTDQIDFIKTRDNLWSDKRIYAAVRALKRYINKHNFRYTSITDHQRQWLEDMIKRLDQYYILRRPRKMVFLNRWKEKRRRIQAQDDLKQRCLRQVNPPFYDWLQEELQRVETLIAEDRREKRRKIAAKNQTRLDWIEGRIRRWDKKIRPDQRPKSPEVVPPHVSRQPYYEKNYVTKVKYIKPQQIIYVPHKPLVEIAKGVAEANRLGKSRGARDPTLSKHLDPRTHRVSASDPKPVKPGSMDKAARKHCHKGNRRLQLSEITETKSVHNSASTTKDLADVHELIQSIDVQQQKLVEELKQLKLKKQELTGTPEPEEGDTSRTVTPIVCKPAKLPPLPAKELMKKHHEEAHRTAGVRHDYALQERSNAVRSRRELHTVPTYAGEEKRKEKTRKRNDLDKRTKDLLEQVYSGVRDAIDEYIDTLVQNEFSNVKENRPQAQPA
ncbi:uncharacterized protein LOC129599229 [Paramacrobiotus metropolitanus]|uniref:uncharacterized protein LOC129599229 n=1 Tax=Paramacrobiotus metropolitanus TaxID=2943436 RepID=UPI002445DD82|nr:uncharacterized protein LOC129599229 [Paramacrobiotus metropolitanus]